MNNTVVLEKKNNNKLIHRIYFVNVIVIILMWSVVLYLLCDIIDAFTPQYQIKERKRGE